MYDPKVKFLDVAEGLHPRVADEVNLHRAFIVLFFSTHLIRVEKEGAELIFAFADICFRRHQLFIV